MKLRIRPCLAASAVAAISLFSATAYGQGEVQRQYDLMIKGEMNRLTKYHNNADDYPKASEDAAWVKKMSDDFNKTWNKKRPVVTITATPSARENLEWTNYQEALAAYRAGDGAGGLAVGAYLYNKYPNKGYAFETWMSVADKNVESRFLAGRMLYYGEGTASDTERGSMLMRSAAAAGHAGATAYLKTLPVARVATVGEFPSMLTRVMDVFNGRKPAHPAARSSFNKVKQKSTKAYAQDYEIVALDYIYGLGVLVDLQKARELLLTARKMTEYHHDADEWLAWLAFLEVDKNPAAFISQAKVFEPTHPSQDAYYLRAIAECLQHRPAQQRFLLEKEAAYNTLAAQMARVDLAVMQLTGEGGLVDEASGVRNLLSVPRNRHAQYFIAQLNAKGLHGITKNPETARNWLEAAAKQGQPDAIRELGALSATAKP